MEKPGIKKNMDISKMGGVGETPIDIIKNIHIISFKKKRKKKDHKLN